MTFELSLLATYYLVLGVLALYGFHRLVLLAIHYRTRKEISVAAPPGEWPRVTVQLPVYNERYVVERLIKAVCSFDYPADRLQIQVLDDSTDETRELVAREVARQRSRGIDIQHLHREERTGFKAGALAAGLDGARGELVAIFDADFLPRHDFLRHTVPHFNDPSVGVVQACWDHVNRSYSCLTRAQALLLDGHFLIEHSARNRSGRFFNFNGTAGVWRRRAIEEAGGWQHDTLTEDLDLSYRAQLAGWRFLFLPSVKAPAELPVDVHAFKRQQSRWAKGSIQTARKLLGTLLRAPLPWRTRLEGAIHLTNNAAYVLLVCLSLLVLPAMMLRRDVDPGVLLTVDAPLFLGATIAVMLYYVAGQRIARGSWRAGLRDLPVALGLGIGLAVNNARAVLEGLRDAGGTFERTPKYGIRSAADRWRGKAYQVRRDPTVLVEGLLAVYLCFCTALAHLLGMWWSLPFLALFLYGYCYIFWLSVGAAWLPSRRAARRSAPPLPE